MGLVILSYKNESHPCCLLNIGPGVKIFCLMLAKLCSLYSVPVLRGFLGMVQLPWAKDILFYFSSRKRRNGMFLISGFLETFFVRKYVLYCVPEHLQVCVLLVETKGRARSGIELWCGVFVLFLFSSSKCEGSLSERCPLCSLYDSDVSVWLCFISEG